MHRFLGYRYGGALHNIANFIIDFVLLVCFVIILKPLALLLIYVELLWGLVAAALWLVISEILLLFVPIILATFAIFDGAVSVALKPKSVAAFEQDLKDFHAETRLIRAKRVSDKFQCIFSFSLLLRFLPGSFNKPSNVFLRKHDRLYKHSFLYRIVRHVI